MTAEQIREIVSAGAGYVPADGSMKTCGDINASGLPCAFYQPKVRRCIILGPNLDVAPAMSCIVQTSGVLPNEHLIQPKELVTPREVGLVDTVEGATCKLCDMYAHDDLGRDYCPRLTAIAGVIAKAKDSGDPGNFLIEDGACCAFWEREGVQRDV